MKKIDGEGLGAGCWLKNYVYGDEIGIINYSYKNMIATVPNRLAIKCAMVLMHALSVLLNTIP